MKTGSMIVARCWSGRFPGKVIAPLFGKPVVEWIIRVAKRVTPGAVVIAGSDHPADAPLFDIARRLGVECARGPANDLLGRMECAADLLGLTHWLEFLGDSPFVVEGVAQAIVKAIHEHPEGLEYSAGPYPAGLTGVHVAGSTREKLRKARELVDDPRVQALGAEGWDWWAAVAKVFPGYQGGGSVQADVTDLFNQPASGFSLCIDYPLQLAFWNMVCTRLGHFPDYSEILKVHAEWRTL